MCNLITARLRLEPLRVDHALQVCAFMQDPKLYRYIPQEPPNAETLRKMYAFWAQGMSPDGQQHWLNWIAFSRDAETPVGTFQATVPKRGEARIGYTVFSPFWRQGFAQEMARTVIAHLFDTFENPGICAEMDTRNVASIRLVESLGFTRIATTPNADFFKGAASHEFNYAISRGEWCLGSR